LLDSDIVILLSAISVLSSLGSLLFLGYLLHTLKKAPRFSDSIKKSIKGNGQVGKPPAVSVIITAKNEEEMIKRSLESVTSQTYSNLEIIVVDDSSEDRTRDLALDFSRKDPRIRVVDAGEKPSDWVGKSWACWRGNEFAKGDLLLYMDADSVFERNEAIEDAVAYFNSKGYDMFSISPRVNSKSIWSSSTLPIVSGAIDVLYPLVKVNNEKSERAYVFGTFILVRKRVYEAIGGHKEVRHLIVEDQAIAQRAKSSGYRLRVENGSGYLATDWEEEFSKIYSGLERVTSSSIRSYGLVSILNAFLLFFTGIYPIIFFVGGGIAFLFLRVNAPILGEAALEIGLIASLFAISSILVIAASELRRVVGRVSALPLLYPIGILIFISAIVTTSIKVSRGRGIEWKGAHYSQPTEQRESKVVEERC